MSLTIIDNKNIYQKDVIGNVRKAQEDSHDIAALTPNGDVFVVCDGMGGHVGCCKKHHRLPEEGEIPSADTSPQ